MIAIRINQTFPMYFPNHYYNRNNPADQQKLYECVTLLWRMSIASLNHEINENGGYYCAVFRFPNHINCTVLDVFQMNDDEPYILIRQAINRGIIVPYNGGFQVQGFQYRFLDDHVDIIPDNMDRKFLLGQIANNEIRNRWIGHDVVHNGTNPVKYV